MQCKAKNPISTHSCPQSRSNACTDSPILHTNSNQKTSSQDRDRCIIFRNQFLSYTSPRQSYLSCRLPRRKRSFDLRQGNVEEARRRIEPGITQGDVNHGAIRGSIPDMRREVVRLAVCFGAGVHEQSHNQPVQTQDFSENENQNHSNVESGLLSRSSNTCITDDTNSETGAQI